MKKLGHFSLSRSRSLSSLSKCESLSIPPLAWRLPLSAPLTCLHSRSAVYDSAFEIVLMVGLPGKTFYANPTATGHVPVYKANGMFSYVVTLATLCALVHTDL